MFSGSQAVFVTDRTRIQAGEDLEEDEEKEEDEEEAAETSNLTATPLHLSEMSESTPLLQATSRSRSRSRRRRMSVGPHGDATVTQAVLMVRHLCVCG